MAIIKRDGGKLRDDIVKYFGPEAVATVNTQGPTARGFADVLGDYYDAQERSETMEAVWPVVSALDTSIRSIVADAGMANDQKVAKMQEAVDQFMLAIKSEFTDGQQEEIEKNIQGMLETLAVIDAADERLMASKLIALEDRVGKLMDELDISKAMSQEEAGYEPDTGDDEQSCGNCEHFDAAAGSCSIVEGAIVAAGWCDYWDA